MTAPRVSWRDRNHDAVWLWALTGVWLLYIVAPGTQADWRHAYPTMTAAAPLIVWEVGGVLGFLLMTYLLFRPHHRWLRLAVYSCAFGFYVLSAYNWWHVDRARVLNWGAFTIAAVLAFLEAIRD